jgi:hypothetical protein
METSSHDPAPPRPRLYADRWWHFLGVLACGAVITVVAAVGCRALAAHLTINVTRPLVC